MPQCFQADKTLGKSLVYSGRCSSSVGEVLHAFCRGKSCDCGCNDSWGSILDLGGQVVDAGKSAGSDGFLWDLCLWTKIDGLHLPDFWVDSAPNWVSFEDSMGGLNRNSICLWEHEVGEDTHDDQPAGEEEEYSIFHRAQHGGEALANDECEELHIQE